MKKVCVIGTGVIGASWCTLFLAKGLDVVATDISEGAEERLRAYIDNAWGAMEQLGLAEGASKSRLVFEKEMDKAIRDVDFIQENGPERIEFKRELYNKLDNVLDKNVIIASSSSGLTMSEIQKACDKHPERCLIAHPFNPPHLIPLVELVGGEKTSTETIDRADTFYSALGKKTVRVNKEVPGHIANRLQAAICREVYHLVSNDIISAKDIDTALSWGPGLRWGTMGQLMLNHLGGGQGGIEHFFNQFTGPMLSWWATLGNPEMNEEEVQKIIASVHEETQDYSFDQLSEARDKMLLALLDIRNHSELQ